MYDLHITALIFCSDLLKLISEEFIQQLVLETDAVTALPPWFSLWMKKEQHHPAKENFAPINHQAQPAKPARHGKWIIKPVEISK